MKKKNNPKPKNNQNNHHQPLPTLWWWPKSLSTEAVTQYWSWEVFLSSGYQHLLAEDPAVPRMFLNIIKKWFILALLGCGFSLLKANLDAALEISPATSAGGGACQASPVCMSGSSGFNTALTSYRNTEIFMSLQKYCNKNKHSN